MNTRTIIQTIPGQPTSDGADVKLIRSLGSSQSLRLDPFLMLDEFSSDDAKDYIGGFPPHPHRGFETVTYMLKGHMRHEDHLGNRGELKKGGVQWMTAGSGIIHSEMPQQDHGRMHGFQLWINLPARQKMKPASYRDVPAEHIPYVTLLEDAGRARVIAGVATLNGENIAGPFNDSRRMSTDPLYLDVHLSPSAQFTHPLTAHYNALIYLYRGNLHVGGQDAALHAVSVLSPGESLETLAGAQGARFLLLAGRPLNEPIAQHGPFVMNTRAEIEQAMADYQNGTLAPGMNGAAQAR